MTLTLAPLTETLGHYSKKATEARHKAFEHQIQVETIDRLESAVRKSLETLGKIDWENDTEKGALLYQFRQLDGVELPHQYKFTSKSDIENLTETIQKAKKIHYRLQEDLEREKSQLDTLSQRIENEVFHILQKLGETLRSLWK